MFGLHPDGVDSLSPSLAPGGASPPRLPASPNLLNRVIPLINPGTSRLGTGTSHLETGDLPHGDHGPPICRSGTLGMSCFSLSVGRIVCDKRHPA